jgi:hypothetical protein
MQSASPSGFIETATPASKILPRKPGTPRHPPFGDKTLNPENTPETPMTERSWIRRLTMLSATATLAGGALLMPATAFAAPAPAATAITSLALLPTDNGGDGGDGTGVGGDGSATSGSADGIGGTGGAGGSVTCKGRCDGDFNARGGDANGTGGKTGDATGVGGDGTGLGGDGGKVSKLEKKKQQKLEKKLRKLG